MTKEHVSQSDIAQFADDRVNLPREYASTYREQVGRLRDRLDTYLTENPDFELVKMLLSGSLAKGTALRSLNDIDVAMYVKSEQAPAPSSLQELLNYLAERLRKAFPNISPEQVQPQTYSVTISFKGTGLDVDVVPILYSGDPKWRGYLISQDDGSPLMTSIPMHLDFVRKRKAKQEQHFAEVIRLAKFWAKLQKDRNTEFRFKSFMVELIMAHLLDEDLDCSNYHEALACFFNYIVKTGLKSRISFQDYYLPVAIRVPPKPLQIIDPVNPENNVADLYTAENVDLIRETAEDAADAIDYAGYATTKAETVAQWQRVFGPTFGA
jgi:tRNA nucleotidyltransferase (CCA-adding enzyme)